MLSDIDIVRRANIRPINDIADALGIGDIIPHGLHKAKLPMPDAKNNKRGKLILVTAITPTPAGEGKTTTSVGLTDALCRIGKKAAVALREPSLGPVFGMKGGAAGGGYAQVIPMEDINLHFTGDFSAISLAHNLLSAAIDNHLHHGNALQIDSRRIQWRRVVDMNDRALRQIVAGLGGPGNGFSRGDGFDIVVASEVMAILCLSESLADLKRRIRRITIGETTDLRAVTAGDIGVAGAMAALLKDAIRPNLAQTLENNPAFLHGGPFANIAHGCNSVLATRSALQHADYAVTEAGFGADLGAEKFVDIKCRKSGLRADAAVLVATLRALKYHGGAAKEQLNDKNPQALKKGFANAARHIRNIREHYGLPVVVALNHFAADTDEEIALLRALCAGEKTDMALCRHWAKGGEGALELAEKAAALADSGDAREAAVYDDNLGLMEKFCAVGKKIYGAGEVRANAKTAAKLAKWQQQWGHLPVCIAKTQYAFGSDPAMRGLPADGHLFELTDARLCTGAEFVVGLGGDIMTMPGLPKHPAAADIDIDDDGNISGLF
ncbi:MAG: formate--tetrahydrofolate ligase [Gammaproteobacteria bacterium]